jgi:uncharacterized protein (TIGR02996 family)
MLGVYVCLGNQRTIRFELPRAQVKIGSHNENDLVLPDGGVHAFHCTLTCEDGVWTLSFAPSCEVRINGRVVGSPHRLVDRDQLAIGAYHVVLALALRGSYPTSQLVERALIEAVATGDDTAAMVYADWLEERGDCFRADFLRLQQIAFADGTNAKDRQVQLQRNRLRELASHIDITWRQRVGRGDVTGCSSDECPGDWARLAPTDDPRIRSCDTCQRDVYYCRNLPEAQALRGDDHPAVIDIRDFGMGYPRY